MKKVFASLTIVAALIFGMSMNVVAQEAEAAPAAQQETVAQEEAAAPAEEAVVEEEAAPAEESFHKALKTKFIEGGAGFMSTVAFCFYGEFFL